jgi:deoxyribonuclease-4
MFGSHLSIAGGLHNALIEAKSLDMDCVQVFTKNQRQWKAPPLTSEAIDQWFAARAETGIDVVVSHDSYLINLASPKADTREKSVGLFLDEVRRCDVLDIPLLVTHPGAHMGEGEAAGLKRIIRALDRVHRKTPEAADKVTTCLEITAGQGTTLGYKLEHLAEIIEGVEEPDRLAVCIDTAHALAAGYDLTSAAGARGFRKQISSTVGLKRLKVMHINDSKVERGRRVDRHAHIGQGHVALDAFKVLCKSFRGPKILETPKEDDPKTGKPMDRINIDKLKRLMR